MKHLNLKEVLATQNNDLQEKTIKIFNDFTQKGIIEDFDLYTDDSEMFIHLYFPDELSIEFVKTRKDRLWQFKITFFDGGAFKYIPIYGELKDTPFKDTVSPHLKQMENTPEINEALLSADMQHIVHTLCKCCQEYQE